MENGSKISLTVDIILFTIQNSNLEVLLIKRLAEPFRDFWAIPGGFIKPDEEISAAAERELCEETGVKNAYLAQLYTKGDIGRDPRGRVITVVYYALLDSSKIRLCSSTDAKDATWFPIKKLPKLAFDHEKIISHAVERLRNRVEYTNIAFRLLPKKFTLSELQKVYEIILDRKLDKRNFRKNVKKLNILEEHNETKMTGIHRPAKLYSFIKSGDLGIFRAQKRVTG
ncbi:MAG: NUDIX domain-containing protein [Candidatus Woesearchaeota archaeon]|nr:NUDIX domain-containing protein [Candidatus Woesearchaeota archaeon]